MRIIITTVVLVRLKRVKLEKDDLMIVLMRKKDPLFKNPVPVNIRKCKYYKRFSTSVPSNKMLFFLKYQVNQKQLATLEEQRDKIERRNVCEVRWTSICFTSKESYHNGIAFVVPENTERRNVL